MIDLGPRCKNSRSNNAAIETRSTISAMPTPDYRPDSPSSFFWHRLRWRAIRRYIPNSTPLQLVDIGAGAGLIGSYLEVERPNVRYRFVEPIPSFEADLERRYGPSANLNGAASLPGTTVATLLDVLEHQADDRRFLGELVKKLDHGTILIITVPAMPRLWSAFDENIGHFKRYTKRQLAIATSDLGLRPLEVSYLFPEMIPAGLVRRRQQPPSGSRRAADMDTAMVETLSDLPNISAALNQRLYTLGSATQAFRRVLPAGTSLLAAYRCD